MQGHHYTNYDIVAAHEEWALLLGGNKCHWSQVEENCQQRYRLCGKITVLSDIAVKFGEILTYQICK